jgi:hypothetical protein
MEIVSMCTHAHVVVFAWACLAHTFPCFCDGRAFCPAFSLQVSRFTLYVFLVHMCTYIWWELYIRMWWELYIHMVGRN